MSEALGAVIGEDAGANFHSWAVWGSNKAGITIRRKDFHQAFAHGAFGAFLRGEEDGLRLAWLAGDAAVQEDGDGLRRADSRRLRLARPLLRGYVERTRGRAVAALHRANRELLLLTGGYTPRFIEAFHDLESPDPRRLDAFLATSDGANGLVRRAYERFYEAKFTTDLKRRHEAMYFGNIQIVFHEMLLLQRFIQRALPRGPAGVLFPYFTTYEIGDRIFRMREDVPRLDGRAFPSTLETISDASLRAFLGAVLTPSRIEGRLGSTGIAHLLRPQVRLTYLFLLTRVLHTDPEVRKMPFTAEEMDEIDRGRIPATLS